jgi:hypothetical protein
MPTPIHPCDALTTLEPKQQGAFPDPVRFPPPKGSEGSCGCLLTEWPNPLDGNPPYQKLETIWQPLWDTVSAPEGMKVMNFFSGDREDDILYGERDRMGYQKKMRADNGRSFPRSIGAMFWPKKFTMWELELQFSDPNGYGDSIPSKLGLLDTIEGDFARIRMQIGEKWHLDLPFASFFKAREDNYRAALCTPLFLPSIQNFGISLTWPRESRARCTIRCVLNGYLHREIP